MPARLAESVFNRVVDSVFRGEGVSPAKECKPVAVSSILLGQIWQLQATGENWLITKVYSEVFASYAVLRKVGGTDADVRRVKVDKAADGVGLPGFIFTQDADPF
jgi:hypothetical protein